MELVKIKHYSCCLARTHFAAFNSIMHINNKQFFFFILLLSSLIQQNETQWM